MVMIVLDQHHNSQETARVLCANAICGHKSKIKLLYTHVNLSASAKGWAGFSPEQMNGEGWAPGRRFAWSPTETHVEHVVMAADFRLQLKYWQMVSWRGQLEGAEMSGHHGLRVEGYVKAMLGQSRGARLHTTA